MRMIHRPTSSSASANAPAAPTPIPVPHSLSNSSSPSSLAGWVPFERGSGSTCTARSGYDVRYTSESVRTASVCNEATEYHVDYESDHDKDYKKQEMGVRVLIGLVKRSAWWLVLVLILVTVCALSVYLMHYGLASGVMIGDGLKPSLSHNSGGGGFTRTYRRSADVLPIDAGGGRGDRQKIQEDEIG